MKKQILFLDLDGVLNTVGTFAIQGMTDNSALYERGDMRLFKEQLEPGHIKLLDYMLTRLPDAIVVISSNWRKYYTIAQIRIGLRSCGLSERNVQKLLDTTPIRDDENRAKEILEFFDQNYFYKHLDFLIIDDKPVSAPQIQTDPLTGLTFQNVIEVLNHFNIEHSLKVFAI